MTSLTVNVDLQFRIGKCENVDHMKAVLVANVLLLMRYRRKIYPDLCPTDACSNMLVSVTNVCKGDTADVRLTIVDVSSRLKEDGTSLYRDADQVILGAFYDLTPLFDNINILPCKSGEIMDLSGTCSKCQGGEFANHTSGQCERCGKGSFSEQPADSCVKCPDGETTKNLGSKHRSDCFKDMELVIIVSASCGGVALISIIITIVVCISIRRRRTSRHQQGLKTFNERPEKAQRAQSNDYTKTAHVQANSKPRSRAGSNPSRDTNQPTLYHIPQPEIDVDVMSCHYYLKLEPPDLDYLAPDYDTSSVDYSKNIDDNIYDEITSK
ncbi:uncharacterized protein LOC131954736 [Physella acuta]|uniref:uncharacterized protein LOC131954736 n=1 Tax=Physella acuta TaxID=109671 RepID=UPI0027DB4889|nr:uncharacterized protein LOC131954736 [Physella acuta]